MKDGRAGMPSSFEVRGKTDGAGAGVDGEQRRMEAPLRC